MHKTFQTEDFLFKRILLGYESEDNVKENLFISVFVEEQHSVEEPAERIEYY